jgi:hypothetical protein
VHLRVPWRKKEKFFLVEALPGRIGGLLLDVDSDRRVTIRRSWHDLYGRRALGAELLLRRVRSGRFGGTVIISADPSLAFTVSVPVSLERDVKGEPLQAVELENLLSQAIGKVFSQCREIASRALGIDDLDTMLVNSRVLHFKVDGHRIINPIGFKARTVDAVLDLTLTTRAVFERVRKVAGAQPYAFFTETGGAELAGLQALDPMSVNLLITGVPGSVLFNSHRTASGYDVRRASIDWRSDCLRNAVADAWNVSVRTADELYASYISGHLSPAAARAFAKILYGAFKPLLTLLATHRIKGTVYVQGSVPLPVALPFKRGAFVLAEPPLDALFEHFGFSLSLVPHGIASRELVRRLAPFLEFYYDKSDSSINRWLRRHLHWLGSSL